MITEQEIHDAVDFLVNKAPRKMADAKKKKAITEGVVKSIKAEEFLRAKGTVANREAEALCSDNYKNAMNEYAEAVRVEELIKRYIDAAQYKIEVWRTEQATRRNTKL